MRFSSTNSHLSLVTDVPSNATTGRKKGAFRTRGHIKKQATLRRGQERTKGESLPGRSTLLADWWGKR
jgi:hypothetical protein